MMKQKKPVLFILLFSGFVLFLFLLMQPYEVWHFAADIALLFPKGIIALRERDLLFIIQILMLLVVIPVYILTFAFSWRYNAHAKKSRYNPELEDSPLAEFIWWGIPCFLVLIIGTLTWIRTFELDPLKPFGPTKKIMKIQVVALQWNWLFIYPEEKIATLNFVQFPEKTPINFEITADAPMNSFWIPKLGSQIYAMPKMRTAVHLIADEAGDYRGSSANLSGAGFAGMHFIARASTQEDFKSWVNQAQQSTSTLNAEEYDKIAQPSLRHPVVTYKLTEENLFDRVIMKFMHPQTEHSGT